MPKRHIGPRYFSRFGQATWIGVLRDPHDKPIGPYVTSPNRVYGDMTPEVRGVYLEELLKGGNGPVYMDCRGISKEDYEYMMHWMWHEGNAPLLDYMKKESIDIRRHHRISRHTISYRRERYGLMKRGRLLPGLYSAGDESMGGISSQHLGGLLEKMRRTTRETYHYLAMTGGKRRSAKKRI
jgi:hypothetical protein